jgi:hypothetical protein
MSKHHLLLVVVSVLSLTFGGFAASVLAAPGDSVAIREITTEVGQKPGTIAVRVVVDYSLSSKFEGDVLLGFDLHTPNSYVMVGAQRVTKGSGTVEIRAEIKRPERSSVTVYVNLSEYPRPQRWTPLTSARKPLELSPGK